MGAKASRKNFYMEIRKSPGRFLSIFFIVALGVAFFSGIRSSEPSMRITGDAYFDGANLMDIQVMSTLGITEDDIDAIEKVDGVELAEGSYSSDFLCNTEDKQYVFHVMSLTDEVNEVSVSEGRLPEKTGECLMDADMGYEVGDKIVLTSGTEDPLEDTLKTDTYTVVGLGSSPCYVSIERGSTTIGSGSVSAFMMVPEETFALDVYTEAYVKVEGASDLTAYTDEYDSLVSGVMDRIEEITGERGEIRKNEILEDAQEEIDEEKSWRKAGQKRTRSLRTHWRRLRTEKISLQMRRRSWKAAGSSWKPERKNLFPARMRSTAQRASMKAAFLNGRPGRQSMKAALRNIMPVSLQRKKKSGREKENCRLPDRSLIKTGRNIRAFWATLPR